MKEFFTQLTWVDYITFIAVLRGLYVGYKSGLFPEILRILAYVVTVVVTFHFHDTVAQYLTLKTFLNQATAAAIAFFVLLVGVLFAMKLVTSVLLKLLKVGDGGFFYRLMGSVVGAIRWVILLSLLFMVIDYSPLAPLRTDIHSRSVTGPRVAMIAPMLFAFLSTLSPQLAVDQKTS